MPSLNYTFQESSPLIVYSGDWIAVYDHGDPNVTAYNGIFRPTTAEASAKLNFLGTGVSIFGAKRGNHGPYSVILDNQPPFQGDGFASPNVFNISLFGETGLSYGNHTVTITNMPQGSRNFLDIDYISIERQFGNPEDQLFNLTVDNTSPLISLKGRSWTTIPIPTAYNSSLARTDNGGDQLSFSFQGCSVEVYGQYANADYTTVLDDNVPTIYRGFNQDLVETDQQPQTLLFLADNLDEDQNHTVLFTNINTNGQRPFYFDYAVLHSVRGDPQVLNLTATGTSQSSPSKPGATTSTAGGSITPSPVSAHSSHTGAIAGGIVGGIIILGLILLGLYYVLKRRQISTLEKGKRSMPEPYTIPVRTAQFSRESHLNGRSHQKVSSLGCQSNAVPSSYPTSSTSSGPISTVNASYGAATSSSYYRSPTNGTESQSTFPTHAAMASNSSIRLDGANEGPKPNYLPLSLASEPEPEPLRPGRETDFGTVAQSRNGFHNNSLPPAYDARWENGRTDM